MNTLTQPAAIKATASDLPKARFVELVDARGIAVVAKILAMSKNQVMKRYAREMAGFRKKRVLKPRAGRV